MTVYFMCTVGVSECVFYLYTVGIVMVYSICVLGV